MDSRGVAIRSKAMLAACFSEMYLPVAEIDVAVVFADVAVVFAEVSVGFAAVAVVFSDAAVGFIDVAVVFADVTVVFPDAAPLASDVAGAGFAAVVPAIVPVVSFVAVAVVVASVWLSGSFPAGSAGLLDSGNDGAVKEASGKVATVLSPGLPAGWTRQSRMPAMAKMIVIPVTMPNANPKATSLFHKFLRSIWILPSCDAMVNIAVVEGRKQVENMQMPLV